jgi:tryptophan 7-halogenase
MKICVIGTGAAGWMACNNLVQRADVDEVIIVGSSKIPTIGVGESTTGRFDDFLETINATAEEFIRESDATVKYGVYYHGWSPRDFIHTLKSQEPYYRMGTTYNHYGRLLGKKDPERWLHDYIDDVSWDMIKSNHVSINASDIVQRMRYKWEPIPNTPSEYTNTWQFEAGKFIGFMQKLAARNPKIRHVDALVTDCEYNGDDITGIVLEDGTKVTADYYVISTGETDFNERVFRAEYTSLGDVLLTDRALFTPLEYEDKRGQIHPYTVAKAMKYGWRWITPTYSRIGTGYAFSSKHVSDEEAIAEFVADIGDPTIKPFVVDFKPRTLKRTFRNNHAFVGMAAGFMEPLDAPGLDQAVNHITAIGELLDLPLGRRTRMLEQANRNKDTTSQWWTSFILCQYKTCHRNDTQFWIDQKAVKCDYYDELMANISDLSRVYNSTQMMFYSTIAGKDINWDCGDDLLNVDLIPVMEREMPTIHHLDWLESMRAQ